MIFFNFWVGPEDDLGMVEAWLGGGWGVVRPMIPPLGGSIDFDTGNRFPLVLGSKSAQKPWKIASKFWYLGVPRLPKLPCLLLCVRLRATLFDLKRATVATQ